MVDAPPGGPDPEGSDKGLGHGMCQVMDQSHMVTMNHRCDSTGGSQGNVSHENSLAGMPIPAMLPDNQCSVLHEEDDQHQQIARAIQSAQPSKSSQSFLL